MKSELNENQNWTWVVIRSGEQDSVSALPLIRALLNSSKNSILIWCDQNSRAIFKLALDRGLSEFFNRVKVISFKFELARWPSVERLINQANLEFPPQELICLDGHFSSAYLVLRASCKIKVGFSKNHFSFLYSRIVPSSLESTMTQAARFMELPKIETSIQNIWSPKTHSSLLGQNLSKSADHYCVSLRASAPSAEWPLENLRDFIRECLKEGISISLLADTHQSAQVTEIMEYFKSPLIKSYLGASLEKEIELLESSALLVSNDSRDTILASELAVPILALFGPTLPEFGNAPWRRHSKVLGVANLACRPCHFRAPETCPKKHHKCLKDIAGSQVFFEAQRLLKS